MPWSLLAMAWLPDGDALAAREQLKPLMNAFAYASCVPFSNNTPLTDHRRERAGVLFRAASHEAPADETLAVLERILGLGGTNTLRYADTKKGQRRAMRLQRLGTESEQAELVGFMLAGDTSAQAWITTLLREGFPAQAYGRLLLQPGAKPPLTVQSRGTQVCSCLNVTDMAIDLHLSVFNQGGAGYSETDEARLASLQAALKCGTHCGSCVPELKRRVRAAGSASAMQKTAFPRNAIPLKQLA